MKANGEANWLQHCLQNIGGIPSGPPFALPLRRRMTSLTKVGVTSMVLNLLELVAVLLALLELGGKVPSSIVKADEKND